MPYRARLPPCDTEVDCLLGVQDRLDRLIFGLNFDPKPIVALLATLLAWLVVVVVVVAAAVLLRSRLVLRAQLVEEGEERAALVA